MAPPIGPFPPLTARARARSLARAMAGRRGAVWVFGYGSLMWDAGAPVSERRAATLSGYRRSFCVWTAHARGTPERPGLGLGLVRDSACRCAGVALRLGGERRDAALAQLWAREMWTDIYRPVWRKVETARGALAALVFEVDTASPQYAGGLSREETARYIASAGGVFGPCRDYLFRTVAALRACGADTDEFDALCEAVQRLSRDG